MKTARTRIRLQVNCKSDAKFPLFYKPRLFHQRRRGSFEGYKSEFYSGCSAIHGLLMCWVGGAGRSGRFRNVDDDAIVKIGARHGTEMNGAKNSSHGGAEQSVLQLIRSVPRMAAVAPVAGMGSLHALRRTKWLAIQQPCRLDRESVFARAFILTKSNGTASIY
jgi:hypothetical protein